MADELIIRKAYRLTFATDISVSSANNLRMCIANALVKSDFGSLTVQFASEGGNPDQSRALYNFIRLLPTPIRMHAIGHVGSSGIPVFLAGHRRTCEPTARFFVHEYDWTFVGRQTLQRIDESVQRLPGDIEFARQVIERHTKASPDLLKALDGTAAATVLPPEEAKTLGFIDEVCELGNTDADGMPIETWTAH